MKIPLSWLKEYLDLTHPIETIAHTLTLCGIEVDSVTKIGGTFSGVVAAKIVEALPHPNADKLKLLQVTDGSQTYQIVCGDTQCAAGQIVALAKIGAQLQDEDGKSWKIKKSKIRDIESHGMLCAADELQLPGDSSGILRFSPSLELGIDVNSLYEDVVFSVSLTPNLGHCLSVYGIARELSAFLQIPLRKILKTPPASPSSVGFIQVEIEDTTSCPKYRSCLIESVQIGPSPNWLVRKLESVGMRSINNAIDISNYVMLTTGQPLHFFDYDLICGNKIFVSDCKEPSIVEILDRTELSLQKGTLLIRDEKNILAIAGIMGTTAAEVSAQTSRILIEAAVFDPASIQKSSRSLGIRSEASYRFERGVDSEGPATAMQLAVDLLVQIAQGQQKNGVLELSSPLTPKNISCRKERVNKILGVNLTLEEIQSLLERLEMPTLEKQADSLLLSIPSYRNDLTTEIDLIEEVARIYGMDHLPKSFARHVSSPLLDCPLFSAESKARELLLREGLQEFLTCDLISPELLALTEEKNQHTPQPISVLHSKSSDFSILRPSLLPTLLAVVKHNFDHKTKNISGFEVGKIHFRQGTSFLEKSSVGIVLSGACSPHHHDPKPRQGDFFDLKGIAENFLAGFGIQSSTFTPSHLHNFQPGRQASILCEGRTLGVVGEIHPRTLDTLGIPERVFFAEFDLEQVLELQPKRITVLPLATQPSSERDWTVTVPLHLPVDTILSHIRSSSSPLLERVFLLDLFHDEKLAASTKNATFRFVYRDPTKTVEFETIEKEHTNMLQKVAEKLANCIS